MCESDGLGRDAAHLRRRIVLQTRHESIHDPQSWANTDRCCFSNGFGVALQSLSRSERV